MPDDLRSTVSRFRLLRAKFIHCNLLQAFVAGRCPSVAPSRTTPALLGSNLIFSAMRSNRLFSLRYKLAKNEATLARILNGPGRNTRRFTRPGPSRRLISRDFVVPGGSYCDYRVFYAVVATVPGDLQRLTNFLMKKVSLTL